MVMVLYEYSITYIDGHDTFFVLYLIYVMVTYVCHHMKLEFDQNRYFSFILYISHIHVYKLIYIIINTLQ